MRVVGLRLKEDAMHIDDLRQDIEQWIGLYSGSGYADSHDSETRGYYEGQIDALKWIRENLPNGEEKRKRYKWTNINQEELVPEEDV